MAFYDKILLGIKLLFSKEKELYSFYFHLLGFCPRNLALYKQACRHRSRTMRTGNGEYINNERLEYLGDALLNSIVAGMLYRKYRRGREGFLTNTRSKIVQREMLNALADKIGLTQRIEYAVPVHTHNCSMGGNALEALVGAVYLDRGYDKCYKFVVDRLIKPHIDVRKLAKREQNFKSKLYEWTQKNKVEITFELRDTHFDSNKNPIFTSVVLLSGQEAGHGVGYSKRESQQEAAKMACKRVEKDEMFCKEIIGKAFEKGM